jgi:hypothetical protein
MGESLHGRIRAVRGRRIGPDQSLCEPDFGDGRPAINAYREGVDIYVIMTRSAKAEDDVCSETMRPPDLPKVASSEIRF